MPFMTGLRTVLSRIWSVGNGLILTVGSSRALPARYLKVTNELTNSCGEKKNLINLERYCIH